MSNKNDDREYQKQYYQSHKEDYARRGRAWRRANPEKCQEHCRKYDAKNKEKIRVRKKNNKLNIAVGGDKNMDNIEKIMKYYLIEITINIPYPVVNKYREMAGRMAVAVKRALDKHRKDHSGRPIKKMKIVAVRIEN